MKPIRLLDLGTVSPLRSQTCYHGAADALSGEVPDTIIFVSPLAPYVCVGFHQDIGKEIDRESCRIHNLPVYRRQVGGGAVYLDSDQVFIQWVFHPSSLPGNVEERFRLFIAPFVRTYRTLGIEAAYRPVNDIQVRGRKIGGTGAARIGNAEVVVGSLMFDFDRAAMARVLRVSSEKMRDKVHKGLEEYMTTIREQAGGNPDRRKVKDLYIRYCAEELKADIVPGEWTKEEEARAKEWDGRFLSPDWLYQKGSPGRTGIKIHEDVTIVESDFKAPGGLIRLTIRFRCGRIDDLSISGDFTMSPRTALRGIEEALRGARADDGSALKIIEDTYRNLNVQSPGITTGHWAEAISSAAGSLAKGPSTL
jgi:lipoate-protein ligase A